MGFFSFLFGKKDRPVARSLDGISLGMTKEEVFNRKGRPLESKTEVIQGMEVGVCVFGAYDASLYWLSVAFVDNRAIRVQKTPKVQGMGWEAESIP